MIFSDLVNEQDATLQQCHIYWFDMLTHKYVFWHISCGVFANIIKQITTRLYSMEGPLFEALYNGDAEASVPTKRATGQL